MCGIAIPASQMSPGPLAQILVSCTGDPSGDDFPLSFGRPSVTGTSISLRSVTTDGTQSYSGPAVLNGDHYEITGEKLVTGMTVGSTFGVGHCRAPDDGGIVAVGEVWYCDHRRALFAAGQTWKLRSISGYRVFEGWPAVLDLEFERIA